MTNIKLDPLLDGISSVELVKHIGSDIDIINAARVSFGKQIEEMRDSDSKLLRYLLDHKHGTPFEHNAITYRVKCPIFVARQWMRHRVGVSYNEISGRYTEFEPEFYVPKEFRKQSQSNKQCSTDEIICEIELDGTIDKYVFDKDIGDYDKGDRDGYYDCSVSNLLSNKYIDDYDLYKALLEQGVAREQARIVLPLATYTEFIFTCNIRSLLHFLALRQHEGAQYEMRKYADALLELARPLFPETFSTWEGLGK